MKSIVTEERRITLDSQPRIRRAWLSPDKLRFLAIIYDNGDGAVKAVQHEERFDLPQLGKVNAFAFNPGSEVSSVELAVAKNSGVERYDLEGGVRFMDLDVFRATAVSYSTCGRLIAVGTSSGDVKVFAINGDKPEEVLSQRAGRSAISAVAFSHSADRLFVLDLDGKLYSVELLVENSHLEVFLQQHGEELLDQDFYCLGCHPSTGLLACAGEGSELHLVAQDTVEIASFPTQVGIAIKQILVLPNSEQFVVVGTAGAEIWSTHSGSMRKQDSIELAEGERILTVQQYGQLLFVVTQ